MKWEAMEILKTKTYHLGKPITIEELYANEILQKNDWDHLSGIANLPEEILDEFKNKLNWKLISIGRDIDADFMEKYKDILFWDDISRYQDLSENDIEQFKDCVDWGWISAKQDISFKFVLKHWADCDEMGLITNYSLRSKSVFILKLVIKFIIYKKIILSYVDDIKNHKENKRV
jgi:hypothetical protein